MKQLAIIGSAARQEDEEVFTLPVWNNCKRLIYNFIQTHTPTSIISGGGSGIDFAAVALFNAKIVSDLTLALPCEFDWQNGQFADNGQVNWQTNPGGTLNFRIRRFSRTIGVDILSETKKAIFDGAKVEIAPGLFERNSLVAKADVILAMTFGNGANVKPGGTMDTCKKYLANGGKHLWHVDLNTMKLFEKGGNSMMPGTIRIGSKRANSIGKPLPDETVIHIDRSNPVLGNSHVLKNHLDPVERDLVIKLYGEDLEKDWENNGPKKREIQTLARRVLAGENLILMCWCAPKFPCHGELIRNKILEITK